eukprot:3317270-Karenia_brevis.AAC.1
MSAHVNANSAKHSWNPLPVLSRETKVRTSWADVFDDSPSSDGVVSVPPTPGSDVSIEDKRVDSLLSPLSNCGQSAMDGDC